MIQNDAMIVHLSISRWTARKYDKAVTQKVLMDYSAGEDVGRFNKALVAKSALNAIDRAVTSARSYHYEQTLPWDDSGGRLLPMENFMQYTKDMRKFRENFDQAVKDFVENYPKYRDDAEECLKDMFNPEDYPSANDIERKFYFGTSIDPVPHSADFRVKLQKKDKTRLEKELEDRVNARLQTATEDLYQRLSGVTRRFVDTLSNPDAIFRDSLVDNAKELVNLLPRLNLTNNAELEGLRKEIASKLASCEPDNLRKVPEIRQKAVQDAEAILAKMNGFLGGAS